jgi:phosphatidylinositol glycan class V
LFLLAAPSLWLLIYSAIDVLRRPQMVLPGLSKSSAASASNLQMRMLASLALPQLVLAVLAFTSYHVQIINRLSSGYPLWYIWLAVKLQDSPKKASLIIRWMVLYGLIQAGLYACFLPPA